MATLLPSVMSQDSKIELATEDNYQMIFDISQSLLVGAGDWKKM